MRRLQLVAAAAVMALGINLLSLETRALLVVSLVVTLAGAAWFLRALLWGDRRGTLYARRREILVTVGSTTVFLVLTLAASLALRLAPRTSKRNGQQYDAELGWAAARNPDTVGEREQKIDPTRQHVLLIGDSVLYGQFLREDETAAWYLNQRYRNVQVLNAAVSGYSLDQYYLSLKRDLPRTRPKVVVVGIFAGNDFQITARNYGWGHSKPMFVVEDGRLVNAAGELRWDNCIDHVAQSALFRLLWSNTQFAQKVLDLLCHTRQLEAWEAAEVDRRLFAAMADEAKAAGAHLLYLLLPDLNDFPNVGDDDYLRYRSRYRQLRELIKEGGYDLLENQPSLARTKQDPRTLFYDTPHMRARGQQLLADELDRYLRDHGVQP